MTKNNKEIEYKILEIISCGEPFSSWVCGDFLEHEIDEDGRSLGKCYFCDECHKKAGEILSILGSLSKEKEMLDDEITFLEDLLEYDTLDGMARIKADERLEKIKCAKNNL